MRGQNKTWWKVLLGIIGACILLVIGWVAAPIGILIYWLWCRKNQKKFGQEDIGSRSGSVRSITGDLYWSHDRQ